MPKFYDPATTVFLVSGPDLAPELFQEDGLPDLLREYGPESLTFAVGHKTDGGWAREEASLSGGLVAADDQFKYYVHALTGSVSGLVTEIGWDV